MVTGIESAGLALAIFPLLVQGLKFYAGGCCTIKDWHNYDRVLKCFARELKMEKCKFENTCLSLLEDMVSPGEIQNLMDNPGGDCWKQHHTMEALRRRLRPNTVPNYLEAIETLLEILQNMSKTFGFQFLDGTDNFGFPDKKTRKYQRSRIKLALRKEDYKILLADIAKINSDLATLTGQRRSIGQPLAEIGKIPLTADFYKQIRTYSIDLYNIFHDKFQSTPTCCCTVPHNVNLHLEARRLDTNQQVTNLRFKVLFSFEHSPEMTTQVPWSWREIEFEPMAEIEEFRDTEDSIGKDVGLNMPKPDKEVGIRKTLFLRMSDSLRKKLRKKKVAKAIFVVTGNALAPLEGHPQHKENPKISQQKVSFNLPADPCPKAMRNSFSSPAVSRIQNLCSTISQVKAGGIPTCLGVLVGKQNTQHRLWPATSTLSKSVMTSYRPKTISLEAVFTQYMYVFMKPVRLRLGVKLASAVMQIHDTEWLSERWSKRDIHFLIPTEGSTPLFDKPFVRRTFARTSSKRTSTSQPQNTGETLIQYNKSIFSLGIILVELWYGKGLQEPASPVANIEPETKDHINKIIEHEDAGVPYGEAVRRCIRGLDHKFTDLDEEDFKNTVHKMVVTPLENNLRTFCNIELPQSF
ncbi:hypothetical protein EDC01DRAFT_189016 [Geopyxis carbonaria]|nr:hypothetical protein EDC01DRAFT_189016 [Geopyxis carbonaria]